VNPSATILIALLLTRGVSPAAPVASPAESVPTNTQSTISLLDGETLQGTLLSQTLTLRTAYGELRFDSGKIASVNFTTEPSALHILATANGNRLTGLLEENTFTLQTQAGAPTEIRREKISQITIRQPSTSSASGPPTINQQPTTASWLRLRNGDLLSGRLLPDPLPLEFTNSHVLLGLKEISLLVLATNSPGQASLRLRNGTNLPAVLDLEFITVELEAGPKVEIYRHAIAVISPLAPEPPLAADLQSPSTNAPPLASPLATNFVWISPGEFLMGSPYSEPGRDPDEGPQIRAVIPQGFWMQKCEVTQAEYEKMTGTNPSNSNQDPKLPVEKVNWFEAMDYCARLTRLAETGGWLPAGYSFRLPTEAEWEYCCRAGTITPYASGTEDTELQLGQYAWFTRNSDFGSKPVGTRKPNAWGLHDMHGNVWEWCLDRLERGTQGGAITNTVVAASGNLRVARGGSWLYDSRACRCANRDDYSPANRCSDIGFRVVLAPLGAE
jgi:formylglycine-generating enzyme required for sulfatase activity